MHTQRRFEVSLVCAVVFIFFVNHVGNHEGWFRSLWWLDVALHLAGGVVLGAFFVYYFTVRTTTLPRGRLLSTLLFAVGFAAIVGIAWEWYEFLADVFRYHRYAYNNFPGMVHYDTLTDLVNDLLGGFLGALVTLRGGRKNVTE